MELARRWSSGDGRMRKDEVVGVEWERGEEEEEERGEPGGEKWT